MQNIMSSKKLKRARPAKTTDDGTYRIPYPIEQRRLFWEYNLNPITGMPPAIDKQKEYSSAGKTSKAPDDN